MRIAATFCLCALLGLAGSASLTAQPPAPSLAELKQNIEADNRHNPAASVHWAEEALRQLAVKPDAASEAWFLTILVRDLNVLCSYPKAEAYLAQGRRLVARSGDARSRFLLEIEAAALLEATEKPGESMVLLDGLLPQLEAYRSRNTLDREAGLALARGHRIRGGVLQTMGLYPEAIGAYQKAHRSSEELADRRGQALALTFMGTLYSRLGRPKDAIASHQQAIHMAEALADRALQAACHFDLANTYGSGDDPDSQLTELKQALELARMAEDVVIQAAVMVNLADVALRKKDYRATLGYADEALKIPSILNDPASATVCQINRGIALNRLGSRTEGLRTLQEALRHVKTTQAKSAIAEITGTLAEEYAFAGDYPRAYELHGEFKALSDELKLAADQKHIAEASAAFESDKKQLQIEGLQREHRAQVRLTLLWVALGVLGFTVASVLVFNRSKLRRINGTLMAMNDQNLALIDQLQSALSEVRTLQGLIPICAHCKKIRDDEGFWGQMETYIQSRTEALFSHGICPDCVAEIMPEYHQSLRDGA